MTVVCITDITRAELGGRRPVVTTGAVELLTSESLVTVT